MTKMKLMAFGLKFETANAREEYKINLPKNTKFLSVKTKNQDNSLYIYFTFMSPSAYYESLAMDDEQNYKTWKEYKIRILKVGKDYEIDEYTEHYIGTVEADNEEFAVFYAE